jgi:hypothetical protein
VSYTLYGARYMTGVADQTGRNTGNWTISFTPDILNVNQNPFEVYKMVVTGAPGSTFTVWVDLYQWDNVQIGSKNSWDPQQPLLMNPGQTLYFFYSDPVTDGIPPMATVWLRGQVS